MFFEKPLNQENDGNLIYNFTDKGGGGKETENVRDSENFVFFPAIMTAPALSHSLLSSARRGSSLPGVQD